jgi:hypothetical protein
MILCGMLGLCRIIFGIVVDLFRPRAALEAEILVLLQQIIVLRRGRPSRQSFLAVGRAVLGWVCHLLPKTRDRSPSFGPKPWFGGTVQASDCFGAGNPGRRLGRPAVPAEIRQVIREMSLANPLWGAPRIHGELLKLGIDIGQTSVAKYMARRRGPPSQGWKDVPAQSCTWDRGDGPICRSDHLLPPPLWPANYGTRPATNLLARRHRTPNGGVACQPTDGGLWLGATPSLSDP